MATGTKNRSRGRGNGRGAELKSQRGYISMIMVDALAVALKWANAGEAGADSACSACRRNW